MQEVRHSEHTIETHCCRIDTHLPAWSATQRRQRVTCASLQHSHLNICHYPKAMSHLCIRRKQRQWQWFRIWIEHVKNVTSAASGENMLTMPHVNNCHVKTQTLASTRNHTHKKFETMQQQHKTKLQSICPRWKDLEGFAAANNTGTNRLHWGRTLVTTLPGKGTLGKPSW